MIYKMTKTLYTELLRDLRNMEVKDPKQKVIEYINSTFGLRGTVTELQIEGE